MTSVTAIPLIFFAGYRNLVIVAAGRHQILLHLHEPFCIRALSDNLTEIAYQEVPDIVF